MLFVRTYSTDVSMIPTKMKMMGANKDKLITPPGVQLRWHMAKSFSNCFFCAPCTGMGKYFSARLQYFSYRVKLCGYNSFLKSAYSTLVAFPGTGSAAQQSNIYSKTLRDITYHLHHNHLSI